MHVEITLEQVLSTTFFLLRICAKIQPLRTKRRKNVFVYGSELCSVGVQRNNFLQLIEVIKQWKFYLNLCYTVI